MIVGRSHSGPSILYRHWPLISALLLTMFSEWKFKISREIHSGNKSSFSVYLPVVPFSFRNSLLSCPLFVAYSKLLIFYPAFLACFSGRVGLRDLAPISWEHTLYIGRYFVFQWLIWFRSDITTVSRKRFDCALPLKVWFPEKVWFNFMLWFPYLWTMTLHE